jgi:predicted outer membrane repeat protein
MDVLPSTIRFVNNTAMGIGGAIVHSRPASSSSTVIRKCCFAGNSAGCKGGALAVTGPGGALVLADSEWSNNSVVFSTSSGGAFCLPYQYGQPPAGGAAVYAEGFSTASFSASSFSNNTSAGQAGAMLLLEGARIDIQACVFEANVGQATGGIHIVDTPTVVTKSSSFINNQALSLPSSAGSGALALVQGGAGLCCAVQCHITQSNFTRNENTENYGGAVLADVSGFAIGCHGTKHAQHWGTRLVWPE